MWIKVGLILCLFALCIFLSGNSGSTDIDYKSTSVYEDIKKELDPLFYNIRSNIRKNYPQGETGQIVPVNPYDEIGKFYDVVLETMLKKFYEGDVEKTKSLEEFIRERDPKEWFVKIMVFDRYRQTFDKAISDPEFRNTDEYRKQFWSFSMTFVRSAMISFANSFDIYNRKIDKPDDLTSELFSFTGPNIYVAWIDREVDFEEVKAKVHNFEGQEDARYFHFNSPRFYWDLLAGREGYLQVRKDHTTISHITGLN